MLKVKYRSEIKKILKDHLPSGTKMFIFGSSVKNDLFDDIDVAVEGRAVRDEQLAAIREEFEESNIPYNIDVINFGKADAKFKKAVVKEKILWLT